MEFLTQAKCDRCGHTDSYQASEWFGTPWVVENCNRCGAEGQFFLKITEIK